MNQYRTNIDATKQIYDPTGGKQRLAAPRKFSGPKPVQQHAADVYRHLGQNNAVNFGRMATQAQNAYAPAALQAQNQSVLGGLANLTQQSANQASESSAYDNMRYRWLNNTIGAAFGALGGLR